VVLSLLGFHGACAFPICFPVQQLFSSEPPRASFFGFKSRILTCGFLALASDLFFMALDSFWLGDSAVPI
jgi:hypothetical protein